MPTRLYSRAHGQSDTGLLRKSNQDAIYMDADKQVYIVADGMGGHAGGEIASSMATNIIPAYLEQHLGEQELAEEISPSLIYQMLTAAINTASTRIYERALEDPPLQGMGTTATVLKIIGHKAFVGHVGDSRLYLLRCGLLYQITQDHSLVSEQVAAGLISEQEAKKHKLRNVITRSVGYQEEECIDTTSFDLHAGDMILLCSDGLHGKLGKQEIAQLVSQQKLKAVEDLISLANQRGGDDNISVIIVAIDSALDSDGFSSR